MSVATERRSLTTIESSDEDETAGATMDVYRIEFDSTAEEECQD